MCENAEAGSLTGLDCSATKLGEVCEQYFFRFRVQRNLMPCPAHREQLEVRPHRRKLGRAHHTLTAAIIGLTPRVTNGCRARRNLWLFLVRLTFGIGSRRKDGCVTVVAEGAPAVPRSLLELTEG